MPYRFRFPTAIYSLLFLIAVYTVACSAQAGDASLDTLRQLTKDGKLPAESVVAGIETRYAGKQAASPNGSSHRARSTKSHCSLGLSSTPVTFRLGTTTGSRCGRSSLRAF